MAHRVIVANRRHLALLIKLHKMMFFEVKTDIGEDDLGQNLSTFLDDPRGKIWILFDEERAIGFIVASLAFRVQAGWSLDLESLYVVPDVRRQGNSRMLLDAAFSWAKVNDALEVRYCNAYGAAASVRYALYARHVGFKDTSTVILSNSLR